ncbi:MAG: P-loop NTPase fold protein, partial [Balneolaceae bacterium]
MVRKQSKSETKLLYDDTPENDAFGGHERIAQSIFDLINQEKRGGGAIALSGSYGSGKSTIIEFLKRIFHQSKTKIKTEIFVFDAWEHQGNSLRRAFIEEYIRFIRRGEIKWAGKTEWQEELEIVSKNREDIQTTTEPFLTSLGGWFAILLLLVPIGFGVLRAGLMDNSPDYIFWLGMSLMALPLIYIIGVYICWRPYTPNKRNQIRRRLNIDKTGFKIFWTKNRPPYHRKSIFNFFSKKSREKVKTTSLKSPDPTTIEFQNVFNTITSEVLEKENRRLIIVIDNIDRLTTDASINAWTTLRTFFDNETKDWNWKNRFWLIAPFDFKALGQLWGGLNHVSDSKGVNKSSEEYVKAFIDKTFQIKFNVPKPILSEWKSFFKIQLEKAFPNTKENIFNDITTLYQIKGINNNSPTPRDIKQFINAIGALNRIWKGEIELPVLAYYELSTTYKREEIVASLKDGTLMDDALQSLLNVDDVNQKLAAIHFNCDLDKANQVLFGNQIASSLRSGNSKNLSDYIEVEGFKDVMWQEFFTIKKEGIPQSLGNSAICLDEIEKNSPHKFSDYFNHIASAFKKLESIKPFNESLGKGIVTIWEKTGYPVEWIVSILEMFSNTELKEENETIKSWFSLTRPILEALCKQGKVTLLQENLTIPGGPKEYIEFLTYVNLLNADEKIEISKNLVPKYGEEQFVTGYTNLLNSEKLPDDLGASLYLLIQSENLIKAKDWNWGNLVNQIQDKIQVSTSARPDQIEAALKMILVLTFDLNKKGAIQLSKNQNFKNGLFFLIKSQKEESIIGLLLLCSILFNPENQKSNDNNVNKGFNTLTNVLEKPDDWLFRSYSATHFGGYSATF